MNASEAYLRAILATVARQTFTPQRIIEIMGPQASEKQYRAFKLCDGSRTQSEIAKELGLDSSNLSKSISRWIDEGIIIRVSEGRDNRPVHIYPLPDAVMKKSASKKDAEK